MQGRWLFSKSLIAELDFYKADTGDNGSGFVPPNTGTFLRHFHWAFCNCRTSFSLTGKDGHLQKVILTTQGQNCPQEVPVAAWTLESSCVGCDSKCTKKCLWWMSKGRLDGSRLTTFCLFPKSKMIQGQYLHLSIYIQNKHKRSYTTGHCLYGDLTCQQQIYVLKKSILHQQ